MDASTHTNYSLKNSNNLLFFLFIISALVGVGISYSKLYLFHVTLIAYFAFLLFDKETSETFSVKKITTDLLHWFYLFSIIWFLIEGIWAENKSYSLHHLFCISIGTFTIYLVSQKLTTKSDFSFFLKTAGLVVLIEIGISLLEIFTTFRWPISRLSEYTGYFGRENDLGKILPQTIDFDYLFSMPTGFQWNSNNLATLMGIAFPFFLLHKNKLFSIGGCLLILLIIIEAGARANFLSVYIMVFASLFFAGKKKIIPVSVVLISLLAISTNFFTFQLGNNAKLNEMQNFSRRMLGLSPLLGKTVVSPEDHSGDIRRMLIANGLDALKKNYGIGLGGGNSRTVQEKLGGVSEGKITSMHNHWAEILVEGGVLYALAYCLWYGAIIWFLFLSYKKNKDEELKYYSLATLFSLLGFIIGAISPASVIYFFPMYLLYGFAVSIIIISQKQGVFTE